MKTYFSGLWKTGKIIHFEKIGSNFFKSGVEPFLNLAGPNFRPKKLGTKFSWEGREVQKKLDPIFASSRLNYFSGFLFIKNDTL
jgi:hypothetical protein